MYYRLLRNDILKSKAITLTTMLFVAAAAMLVALAAILVVNLSGAIDTLMTQAKTPHFTQMHAGELDLARLAAFAEQNEAVADFQALEFLNVDGAQFLFAGGSLADSVQDNGFSVQSENSISCSTSMGTSSPSLMGKSMSPSPTCRMEPPGLARRLP
jgi:putative ABC transport system permease protein